MKAMEVDEKPSEDYSDVGGLDKQIQELVEAIVLPVTHKARPPGSGSGFRAVCASKSLSRSWWRPLCCPSRTRRTIWIGLGLGL